MFLFGAERRSLSPPPPLLLPVAARCLGGCRSPGARLDEAAAGVESPGRQRQRSRGPTPLGGRRARPAAMSELALEELSALAAIYCEPDACEVLAVSGEGGRGSSRLAGSQPGVIRPAAPHRPRGEAAHRGLPSGAAPAQVLAVSGRAKDGSLPARPCVLTLCRGQIPSDPTRL